MQAGFPGVTVVAVLLLVFKSVAPVGGAIVAVLLMLAMPAPTRPVAVNVTVAPSGRFTAAEMLPDPLGGQVPPPEPVHVHVTPARVAEN